MSVSRTGSRLSAGTLVMHWLVGLSVIGLLAYGFWLQTLPTGPGKTPYVQTHKSFGMIVFVLAIVRLAWRWREGFPTPVGNHAAWERRSARALQVFMIAATVLMPVTGILRSLAYARPVSVFDVPVIPKLFSEKQETLYAISANTHDILALALAAAIAVHVAAALLHQIRDRDETLGRMLGGSGAARQR